MAEMTNKNPERCPNPSCASYRREDRLLIQCPHPWHTLPAEAPDTNTQSLCLSSALPVDVSPILKLFGASPSVLPQAFTIGGVLVRLDSRVPPGEIWFGPSSPPSKETT